MLGLNQPILLRPFGRSLPTSNPYTRRINRLVFFVCSDCWYYLNMTNPLTVKQENFCLAYIETGNASEAYRRAYSAENMKPATINRSAKALLDNHKITARIKALQERAKRRHDITIETLTEMYREAFEMGKDIEQPAAMNGSATGLAKLHGLITDKTQAEISVSFGFADRLAKRRAARKK